MTQAFDKVWHNYETKKMHSPQYVHLLDFLRFPVDNIKLAIFADDTAVLALENTIEQTTAILLIAINGWTKRWGIKTNKSQFVYMNFTKGKINYRQVKLNNNINPWQK